jgi:hypothetical protein
MKHQRDCKNFLASYVNTHPGPILIVHNCYNVILHNGQGDFLEKSKGLNIIKTLYNVYYVN